MAEEEFYELLIIFYPQIKQFCKTHFKGLGVVYTNGSSPWTLIILIVSCSLMAYYDWKKQQDRVNKLMLKLIEEGAEDEEQIKEGQSPDPYCD